MVQHWENLSQVFNHSQKPTRRTFDPASIEEHRSASHAEEVSVAEPIHSTTLSNTQASASPTRQPARGAGEAGLPRHPHAKGKEGITEGSGWCGAS